MATSYTVSCNGSRYVAKVGPMAPLSQIVEGVCQQLKPPLDPSSCQLLLNKKPLDLSTPVRFANLPRDAKLELNTGQVRKLGLQAKPAQQPATAQPSTAQQAQAMQHTDANQTGTPAERPAASSGPAAPPAEMHAGLSAQHAQHNMGSTPLTATGPGAAASIQAGAQPQSGSGVATSQQPAYGATAAQAALPSAGAAAPQSAAASTRTAAAVPPSDPLGLGRQVHVFTRDAAMAAEAAARGDTDLPPEFYEFTPDDYRTVVAGYAQKRAKEESGLRTAKLREAEERQKAAAFGPVAVRVHLANGLIIQASFQPLDTVAALQQLVERCLLPTKAKWYLYTTPPKQPLKEATVTLYSAGLVPAANVYFGCDSGGVAEPYLRPEVLAMLAEPPKREQTAAQGQAGDSRSEGGRGGDAAFRSSSTATDGGAKKVPKWMKLGK